MFDELEKKSKLRSFFEKEKECICVPFYPDNEQTLFKLAIDYLKKRKISLSSSSINLIIKKCNGDREILFNELQKIELYSKNGKQINEEKVLKLINLIENHDISELINHYLIKNNGEKKTAAWAKGMVNNFARKPTGNDRAQILAVAAGEADWAVANTYYLALMLSGKKGAEQQAAAKKVMPFFPNQDGRGTHMNISGGGILKHAPNKANAVKLLEFLLTPEAQQHIVNNTFEYPMIPGVKANKLIAQFGLDFKQDLKTKVVNYGKRQADALEVMTAAGWK